MEKFAYVTGAGGLIGSYLVKTAPQLAPGWKAHGLTREELDLTDFAAVRKYFHDRKPDAVIHCAALSRSPVCQVNPDLARKLNVDAVAVIAEACAEIPLISFSSDLIFDGRKGNYVETDQPHAQSIYAETKIAGEQIILANPKHTVIRTSLNAGKSPTGDRAFNEEMHNALRAGKKLDLFVDEFRCPVPVMATVRAVWELLQKNVGGIFHIAGNERLSRFQIGQLLASCWPEVNAQIEASSLKQYKGAPRSPDTSLNCAKVQKLLSFPLPKFSEWVRNHPDEV